METRTHKTIEYSRVMLSELSDELRCDSEFYQSFHIAFSNQVKQKKTAKIKSFADVTDGIHASIQFDQDSSVNLLSAKAPKDNYFDLSATGFIAAEQHTKNPRTALRLDDVVVSTVGTIGNCAVVDESVLPANSDRHVGIIRTIGKKILPHYLSTYLLTKYGKSATVRETAGNVQPNLYIRNIKQLSIPVPDSSFQLRISQLITQAHEQQRQSEQLYQEAEKLLLDELGLSDWKPKMRSFTHTGMKMEVEDTVRTVRLSEIDTFFRFDSEHWKPNLLAIETKIREYGFSTLGLHCFSIMRGIQPKFVDDGDVFVIASKAVRPTRIRVNKNECTDQEFYKQAKVARAKVEKGDVLLNGTGVGTLGRAGIYDRDEPAVADNHVTILRLKGSLNPYFLMLFLNSLPGQGQSERWQTGSSGQLELYPNQIERFLIPNIPAEIQERIGEMIQESYRTKDETQQLLALAKQAVELYIEEDEAAAVAFIESSL